MAMGEIKVNRAVQTSICMGFYYITFNLRKNPLRGWTGPYPKLESKGAAFPLLKDGHHMSSLSESRLNIILHSKVVSHRCWIGSAS